MQQTTQGFDYGTFAAFKRACGEFRMLGDWLIRKIEFGSPATREMCARYADMNRMPNLAAKVRNI